MNSNDMSLSRPRDPRAQTRFARAKAALAEGELAEAAEMIEQALALSPDWPGAWHTLGTVQSRRGLAAQACDAHAMALRLDPADRHGTALALARTGGASVPPVAPHAYVAALFDEYAPRFEHHLTRQLGYRGPSLIVEALAAADIEHFGNVLDLGCGTGLCGAALRARADRLAGVDLSARMIAAAREKAIYDRLAVGDLHTFLAGEDDASADLVVAADVLIYIGDLAPLLSQCARVLRRGRTLAFTTQLGPEAADYTIGADMRFHHARGYVEAALADASFVVARCEERSVRREKGIDVPGLIVVARRA